MAGFAARFQATAPEVIAPLTADLAAGLTFAPLRDGIKFAISPHPEGAIAAKHLRSFADCAKVLVAMGPSAFQLPNLWPTEGDEFAIALRAILEKHRGIITAQLDVPLALPPPPLQAEAPFVPFPPAAQAPAWEIPPPPMRPPPAPVPPQAAVFGAQGFIPDPRIERLSTDLAQVVDHIRRLPGHGATMDTATQQQLLAIQSTVAAQQADMQRMFSVFSHAASSARPGSAAVDWGARVFASSTAWRDPMEWHRAFGAGDLGPLLAMLRDVVLSTRSGEGFAAHAGFSAAMEIMVLSYQATASMPGSADDRFKSWWPALRAVLASAMCVHEHAASEAGGKSTGPRFAAVLRPLLVKLEPDAWTEEVIRKAVSTARAQGGAPLKSSRYGRAPSRGRRGMGPAQVWEDRSVASRPPRRQTSPARSEASRRSSPARQTNNRSPRRR